MEEDPSMIYEADTDRDIPNLGASTSKSIQAEAQRNEEMEEKTRLGLQCQTLV